MLEIQNFIIGFPIFDIYAIAGTEHALAHYVEYVYGRRLVGAAAWVKVCFIILNFVLDIVLLKQTKLQRYEFVFTFGQMILNKSA